MSIVVYTKTNCAYCTSAKNLLDRKGIEYELVDITNNIEAFKDSFPTVRTVPYILVDGKDIGGYKGLSEYLG